MSGRCACGACQQNFATVRAFERHRIGDPGSPGRRCLSIAELEATGWRQLSGGFWTASAPLRAAVRRRLEAQRPGVGRPKRLEGAVMRHPLPARPSWACVGACAGILAVPPASAGMLERVVGRLALLGPVCADVDSALAACPERHGPPARLAIRMAGDGRLELSCSAGCEPELLADALGLAGDFASNRERER